MATLTFEVKQHLTGHIKPLVLMQMQAWFQHHKLQSPHTKHMKHSALTTQLRKTYNERKTFRAQWDDLQLQKK